MKEKNLLKKNKAACFRSVIRVISFAVFCLFGSGIVDIPLPVFEIPVNIVQAKTDSSKEKEIELQLAGMWLSVPEDAIKVKERAELTVRNKPQSASCRWTSSAQSVAVITATTGKVTAKKAGKTTISCTVTLKGKKKVLKGTVIVTDPEVDSVKLTQTAITLMEGKTKKLTAKAYPLHAKDTRVIWKSENPMIAKISDQGLVTAVSAGTVKITASSINGISSSCIVTVTKIPPQIGKITLSCDGDFIPGEADVYVNFTLTDFAEKAEAIIYNQDKEKIRTISLGRLPADESSFIWNGRTTEGNFVPEGSYFVQLNADGRKKTSGKITAKSRSDFARGNGSRNNPYTISNAQDLDKVRNYNGRYFLQTGDIDCSGENFAPLFSARSKFTGQYDGAGFAIRGLTIQTDEMTCTALFSAIGKEGTVKNIRLENCLIVGGSYTAGIAGRNLGTIEDCFVSGFINGTTYVAGICAGNEGEVIRCTGIAIVTGDKVNGIVIEL